MGAFEDAADTLWTDENLSKAGKYRLGGVGPEIDVRVLFGRPMRDMSFGNTGMIASDLAARVRYSEIATPKRDDTVRIGNAAEIKPSDPLYRVSAVLGDSNAISSLLALQKI